MRIAPLFLILSLALLAAPLPAHGQVTAASGPVRVLDQGRGVLIQAGSKPKAGQPWCFQVRGTGQSEGALSVVVEVNGVLLTPTITPMPDGSFEVCLNIPAGAAGGRVDVTVTRGTSVAFRTFRVG